MPWSDQPNEVKQAYRLASFHLANKGTIEVRVEQAAYGRRDRVFFVTLGGLFGSQTLRCEGAEAAFAAIDRISHMPDRGKGGEGGKVTPVTPPAGTTLMGNDEDEDDDEDDEDHEEGR